MLQLPSMPSIMISESITWFSIFYFGNGWIPTDIKAFVLSTFQAQAGCKIMPATSLSTVSPHVTTVSTSPSLALKGLLPQLVEASCQDQHLPEGSGCERATRVHPGKWLPIEYSEKLKCLPCNHQHEYVFLIGPPLLIPTYFQYQNVMTMIIAKTAGLGLGHQLLCPFLHHLHSFCGILEAIFFLNFIRFL